MRQTPAFIAFTGLDDTGRIDDLKSLSARYPIEWGVLVDDAQTDNPLFPNAAARKAFVTAGDLRLAAHVCGIVAGQIANAPDTVEADLTGYQRIQVNHSFTGSTQEQIENTYRFGRSRGVRTMLQCSGAFPAEPRLDWLYDISFGKSVAPTSWPLFPENGPFCGYSGGIGPDTVNAVLDAIDAPVGALYWIDMESRIRTNGLLDLNKCEAVCRAVFG